MDDKYINIIKYYCYPNEKYPTELYNNMPAEHRQLFLNAAAEFIQNVRLHENYPIDTWSNHQERWNYITKK